MSAEGQSGEKTEKPTPKRLADARKKGQVAKSTDLVGALGLLALLSVIPVAASKFGPEMLVAFRTVLSQAPDQTDPHSLLQFTGMVARPGLMLLGVVMATAMLVGVLGNVAQVGFLFSTESITPKLSKLNPMEGIKRLLSRKTIFEAAKASAKGLLFGYLAYAVLKERWDTINVFMLSTPFHTVSEVGGIIVAIGMRVGFAWLVLAAIDYMFQRQQMMKQLMMTKDELKREFKEQEGSPEVKFARQQRARKLSRGRTAEAVKKADVIITNPTHYAIALKYDRSKMHAPMVVAKGVDYLALRIREMAAEANVPVIPNPPLARSLYKHCEIGDFVPRDYFAAVAEVLAFVYKTAKGVKRHE